MGLAQKKGGERSTHIVGRIAVHEARLRPCRYEPFQDWIAAAAQSPLHFLLALGSDEMGDRRLAEQFGTDFVFENAVGVRHALVLAQMLQP